VLLRRAASAPHRSRAQDRDIALTPTAFRWPKRLASKIVGVLLALCFLADPSHAQILVTNDDAGGAGSFASAVVQAASASNSLIEFSGTDGDIALGSPLSVSNTPTIDAAGTTGLTIRNALSLAGALTVNMSGVSGTISGAISDGTSAGSLSAQDGVGGGVLVLSGANTYSGGTAINSGVTVGVTNNSSLGTGAVTFNGGTLQTQAGLSNFANALTLTGAGVLDLDGSASAFSGPISGGGALTITDNSAGGGGAATLTGANTNSGGVNIMAGAGSGGVAVLADAAGALGTGAVTMTSGSGTNPTSLNLEGFAETIASLSGTANSTLNLNGAALTVNGTGASTTFAGTIEDTAVTQGSLTMSGAGSTLVLSGNNNTYSGGTNLNAGTIGVTNNSSLGTGAVTFNGGTLQTQATLSAFNNLVSLAGNGTVDIDGNSSTFSGVISGAGALTVTNSGNGGVLTLSGANAYSGDTTVQNGATLGITAVGNLGNSALLTLSNGGGLQTQAGLSGFGTAISLAGTGGTIDLDGFSSSFNGGIVSGSGALTVESSAGSGVLTLQGTNSYGGGTTIGTGATVAISQAGALGTGGLTFNGGTLQTQLGLSSYNTAMTLTGAGTIDLYNNDSKFTGAISGAGLLTITDSSPSGGGILILQGTNSSTGGTNITGGTGSGGVTVQTNVANAFGSGGVDMTGGSSTANLNLEGYSQTIASLGGDVNSNLNLTGAALTISGTASAGANTTFAGVISDSASGGTLTLSESGGALSLTGVNTYSGGTTLNAGILGITNNASLGTGGLTMNGGTLQTQAPLTGFNTAITLDGAGTIDLDGQTSSFNSGIISGSGALTFTNNGAAGAVLTLQGTNSYSGGTTIANGAIIGILQAGALGTGGLTFNGGTLQTQAPFTGYNTAITLTGITGGTVDLDGNASTFSSAISGAGGLTITDSSANGGGVLTLTGANNTYSGGTNITAGSGLAGVAVQADATNTLGTGGVILTGASAPSTALLNLGGNAETIASLSGNAFSVLDLFGAALTVSGGAPASTTFLGLIQDSSVGGTGTLTMSETGGTLVLSGVNTYTGGTTLNAGRLGVTNDSSLGAGALTMNGGTLQTQAALTSLANAVVLQSAGGTVDLDGFSSAFTGGISGSGALAVINSNIGTNGNNVLTLSGSNSYSGGTTIGAGATVGLTNNASLGTGAVTVDGGALQTQAGLSNFGNAIALTGAATVDLDGNASTFSGAISQTGTGALTITDSSAGGGGALTLSGSNSGGGGLDITAGAGAGGATVLAGAAGVLGTGAVIMTAGTSQATLNLEGFAETIASLSGDAKSALNLNGAELTVNGGVSTTFAGTIKDTAGTPGGLTVSGSGSTLVLSGDNTYAGGTNVASGGTLGVTNNNSLGTGVLTINGGALQTQGALSNMANAVALTGAATLDSAGNSATLSGPLTGAGALTVVDSGSGGILTLSGSNVYSGGTTIDAGATLGVAGIGSLGTGALSVANGGTFNLNGLNQTVAGAAGVVNNGTINTGLGVLTTPSYSGGGTLSVALQSSGPSLNVSGSANLTGGTLSVSNHPAAGIYTVVNAGTLNNTTFSSIVVLPDYNDTSSYSGNQLTLTLSPRLTSYAETPNQRAVAGALFNVSAGASGDLRAVLNQIDALPPAQAVAAFDQISPRSLAAMNEMQFSASSLQQSAVSRHLADMFVGGARPLVGENEPAPGALIASGGVGDTPESWHDTVQTKDIGEYFATATGSEGRLDPLNGPSGAQPGYTFHSGGGTIGVNTPGSEDFVLGFALGYVGSSADVGSDEGSIVSQSLRGGVFAAKRIDDFHGNLYFGGAFDSFSVSQNMAAIGRDATSSPTGTEVDAAGQASYDLHLRRATFTPTVGLSSDHVSIGPAKESGAGSMDQTVGGQSLHSLRSDTGAKLSYRFGGGSLTWTPYASAAYEHEFMNQSQNLDAQFAGPGGTYTITTADIARSGMLLAGGFTLDWKNGAAVQLEYSNDSRPDYDVNTLLVNVRARFQ
jgi:fibronectin-binding autotransporter adhesin